MGGAHRAAIQRDALLGRRPSRAGSLHRTALFMIALACTAQTAAAIRSLRASLTLPSLFPTGVDACCFEVELFTPFLALGVPPPNPGTRFDSARARAVRCSPVAACGADLTALVPTAELDKEKEGDTQRPFSLTMRLAVPSRSPPPAWPDGSDARGPPAGVLLPARTWTHFAGDSLLRGVFSTLTQYIRQARWEQWQGEAYFQSVFHKSRSLCCADVARHESCTFALHNASSETLFTSTRAALAEGRTCVTYSFLMDYAAILAQMRQMAPSGSQVLPGRLVTSAGVHTMKRNNASYYKAEVSRFLAELDAPAWRSTLVAVHTVAEPNYTAVHAGGHQQTPDKVASFNTALREAVAADAVQRGAAFAPRLVDLHAVTTERRGGELAGHAKRRFPRLDALHFRDAFYQTAFVADALALQAAQRTRQAAAPKPS